jgi:hypothetical protein
MHTLSHFLIFNKLLSPSLSKGREEGLLGRRVYNAQRLLEILDRFRDIFKL